MNNQFQNQLNDWNIILEQPQQVDISRIEVDELNSVVDVFLQTQRILPIKDYASIYQAIFNDLDVKDVKLRLFQEPEIIKVSDYQASHYVDYLQYCFKNDLRLKEFSEELTLNINGEVIEIKSDSPLMMFDNINKYLHKAFGLMGLSNVEIKLIKPETDLSKKPQPQIVNPKKDETFTSFGRSLAKHPQMEIQDALDEFVPEVEATLTGVVYAPELRSGVSKRGNPYNLLSFYLFDGESAIKCSCFGNKAISKNHLAIVKNGMIATVQGNVKEDSYAKGEKVCEINYFEIVEKQAPFTNRTDEAIDKRSELQLHTKYSKLSGVSSLDDYAKLASHLGHKALAITDNDVLHAFVQGDRIKKQYGLQMIYGVEANVCSKPVIVENPIDIKLDDAKYCVFDTETTGLSANFNKLIEIGAVMYQNGKIIDTYQQFIKIDEPLSEFISNLTCITDEDLSTGVCLKQALQDFRKWSDGSVLVAHNATFDRQVMARNYERELGIKFDQPIIDTLELSRFLNPDRTYHSLSMLSKLYGVKIDESAHHRADYDADQLSKIFEQMLIQLEAQGIDNLLTINEVNQSFDNRGFKNIIYVKDQKGLAPFYEIVSNSLTKYYKLAPRIKEEEVLANRDHLIYVGGAFNDGSIIDAYLNKSEQELRNLIDQFDYVMINPPSQYLGLVKNHTLKDEEAIKTMLKNIIKVCQQQQVPVVVSGNVYFTEEFLAQAREMIFASSFGFFSENKDYSQEERYIKAQPKFARWYENNHEMIMGQYYKTTDEMLDELAFLDDAKTYVIDNVNQLLNQIEDIQIIPEGLSTPTIDGVDEKVTNLVYNRAHELYGEQLPDEVEARIKKELKSIIGYGYSVIYYISYKLVKYSNDNGYLVGSRGSVGSSIVAFLMGISEVNPLAPHYYCPECDYFSFITDGSCASGYDAKDETCPTCGCSLKHDGQDIPFETFLGFEGDKVPDIDLNFSGDFQAKAHEFVRGQQAFNDPELFDEDHAFRAGTIKTLATKTAVDSVKTYFNLAKKPYSAALANVFGTYCEGARQSTGQHPGGIIVIPQNLSVYDFTPIQYPADKKESEWRTTHFDFHAIHDNVLKLDILGHDDPTMLRLLWNLTDIDPVSVNFVDEKVLSLFTSNQHLNLIHEIDQDLGSLGLPEFGTKVAMDLLRKAKPKTYADLVQVSGLSHGTGVWAGNAEDLIDKGTCSISEVIGCRDDIMVYLIQHGLDSKDAFDIMEHVRKGKGLTAEEVSLMQEHDIPMWYINSCKKIEYMFPKAHASAYVLMALRIGWYKVYQPLAYYSAIFSSRIDKFEMYAMMEGFDKINLKIKQLEKDRQEKMVSKRSEGLSDELIDKKLKGLYIAQEMCARGFKFYPVSLELSQASHFVMHENGDGLIMPFCCIDSLGDKEAESIVNAREEKPFSSVEDVKARTKIKKKTVETLTLIGAFDHLEVEDQQQLFGEE